MSTYFTRASSRLEANKVRHEVLPTFPVLSGLRKKEKIEDLKKNLPLDNPFVVYFVSSSITNKVSKFYFLG